MFVSVTLSLTTQYGADGSPALVISGRTAGYAGALSIPWPNLGGDHVLLLEGREPVDRASPKRRRRASMKQEEEVARMHGGHRNIGSGSVPGRKSDASIREKYRIENKFTSSKGIRVTRADLNKLRSECERGQVPVFQVDFKEPTTLRTQDRWVLVPLSEWEKRIVEATDD